MNDEDFMPSFSKLAAICDCDRGSLRAIRDRDPRFPKQTAAGWSTGAVKVFLHLRELEKMTDGGYRDYCADYELTTPAPGARQAMIVFLNEGIDRFQAIGNGLQVTPW